MDTKEKRELERASLEVINFTNINEEDFEGMWGGVPEIIEVGETKPFPRFLALHYTKHLVNKILIRRGESWTAQSLREPLEKECLGEEATLIENKGTAPAPVGEKKSEEFDEAPKEEGADEKATDETKDDKPVDYNDSTVDELEAEIERRGLDKVDGKKSDLVAALEANDNEIVNLPHNIGNLINLKMLEFENNHLSVLPNSISKLSYLEFLNLQGNQLTSLPTDIGNLFNLDQLRLDNNQLIQLPDSIINLEKIKLLVLRGNEGLEIQQKHEQWFDQIKESGGRVVL